MTDDEKLELAKALDKEIDALMKSRNAISDRIDKIIVQQMQIYESLSIKGSANAIKEISK